MNMQTMESISMLIERVSFPLREFAVVQAKGGMFVRVVYTEPDVENPAAGPVLQQGRKWLISPFATDSEVFQTLLAAALASAEHVVREHFQVDGQRIYGPHLSADVLVALLRAGDASDVREPA